MHEAKLTHRTRDYWWTLAIWFATAVIVSFVVDVLETMARTPIVLRDALGWRDQLLHSVGAIPFVVIPTLLAVALWMNMLQQHRAYAASRARPLPSLVGVSVFSLILSLLFALLFGFAVDPETSSAPFETMQSMVSTAWKSDYWVAWFASIALMIAIPRLLLARRLRRRGVVAFE